MTKPLERSIDEAIVAARNSAYQFRKEKQYESAEKQYLKAWDLLPDPKYDWDSSQILIYKISDFYSECGNYERALFWARQVFETGPLPGDGAPYVTLGKVYFESGDMENAFAQFKIAFDLANKRAFDGEDKKYLVFYKQKASGG